MIQIITGYLEVIFSSLNAEFIIIPVAVAAVSALFLVTFQAIKGRG